MKRYLFYAVLASIVLGCGTQRQYHSKIYSEIYSCQGIDIQSLDQKSKQSYIAGIQSDNIRKLIQWNYLNKLVYSKKNDTVSILNMVGLEGDFYFSIWNKNDTLSYTNVNGKLLQTKERLFTKYMMKLVAEWNIDEIRKEEKAHKMTLPERITYATRITFNKGKYRVDCMRFYDFFDLKRDGMD